MGRQFHLYRLAYGRSAFQPVDKADYGSEKKSTHVGNGAEISDPQPWRQQYSASGRPMNPASNELRLNLQHAHDSILRTVGFSARDYNHLSRKMHAERHRLKAQATRREEDEGDALNLVDSVLFYLQLFCESGVKQRVQAFRSLSDASLWSIFSSGVREEGLLSFFVAGSFSRAIGVTGMRLLSAIRSFWKQVGPVPWYISVIMICSNNASRLLLAPLRIHEIMCKLDCIPRRQILPSYTTYKFYLAALLGFDKFSAHLPLSQKLTLYCKSNSFWICVLFLATSHGYGIVGAHVMRYVTVLLSPRKPGTKTYLVLNSDFQQVGTTSAPTQAYRLPTFPDLVAKDLQNIGRWYQRTWDRLAAIFSTSMAELIADDNDDGSRQQNPTRRSSASSFNEIPEDLREAMGTMTFETPPHSPIGDVFGADAELQDLLDPMPTEGSLASMHPGSRRQQSQPTSSPLAVEVPLEIVEDPHPQSPAGQQSPPPESESSASSGRRPERISSPDTAMARAGSSSSTQSDDSGAASHDSSRANRVEINATTTQNGYASLQFSIPMDTNRADDTRGFHVPSSTSVTSSDGFSSSDHAEYIFVHNERTKLREVPGRALITSMCFHVTRCMMWPVEAALVRNIALAFGPQGAWRDNIIHPPFRPWLGWATFFKQTHKTMLLYAMPAVIGLAVWRLEYSYVWWRGTRSHDWHEGEPSQD